MRSKNIILSILILIIIISSNSFAKTITSEKKIWNYSLLIDNPEFEITYGKLIFKNNTTIQNYKILNNSQYEADCIFKIPFEFESEKEEKEAIDLINFNYEIKGLYSKFNIISEEIPQNINTSSTIGINGESVLPVVKFNKKKYYAIFKKTFLPKEEVSLKIRYNDLYHNLFILNKIKKGYIIYYEDIQNEKLNLKEEKIVFLDSKSNLKVDSINIMDNKIEKIFNINDKIRFFNINTIEKEVLYNNFNIFSKQFDEDLYKLCINNKEFFKSYFNIFTKLNAKYLIKIDPENLLLGFKLIQNIKTENDFSYFKWYKPTNNKLDNSDIKIKNIENSIYLKQNKPYIYFDESIKLYGVKNRITNQIVIEPNYNSIEYLDDDFIKLNKTNSCYLYKIKYEDYQLIIEKIDFSFDTIEDKNNCFILYNKGIKTIINKETFREILL